MIQILELFGGIGAARKALVNLGVPHKSLDYVEWDEKAVRTYNAIFDNGYKPQSVVGYTLQPDILVHGSPCQDFSVAGKQYGGNVGSGTRSSLLHETVKIIRSLGEWKPKVVVWENVKGALGKKMVGAFNHYIEELDTMGYVTNYDILDARNFGVPQFRERVFAISILDGKPFDFNALERKPMKDIQYYLTDDYEQQHIITQPSMIKKLPDKPKQESWGGRHLSEIIDYSWTITTKQMRCPNSGVIRLNDGRWRYLTELECWRLMGFDDEDFERAKKEHAGIKGKLNGTLYHQAGNSIVVDILEAIFKQLLEVAE